MEILQINNTIKNSVTYILYSENVDYCVLIDCGEWDTLKSALQTIGKRVKTVLLTHGHTDHIYGLKGLIESTPSVIIGTNECGHNELRDSKKNLSFYQDMPFKIEEYNSLVLYDGAVLHFDGLGDVKVIATPGHTHSSLSYIVENNLFTGDAYIPGIRTYYKFPGSNKDMALNSMTMLSELEESGYNIYCGHHNYERFL